MERWSIQVDKERLKFSAAHFLVFPDGTAERLHGHNYRVYVEIEALLDRYGLVMDFLDVKPIIHELVAEYDERWILPGEREEIRITHREDGVVEVRYQDRYYAAPEEDVKILPLNNTSVENLSTHLGRELLARLRAKYADISVRELWLAVEETPGQRGVYRYTPEA